MDVADATLTEEAPRVRLRHDLVFAEVPTGTLVRHSDGGFVLRGTSIYRWITTLAPFLDGTKTRGELVAGLDAARAKMVDDLLNVLADKGALSTVTGPTVNDGHELADYRQQIGFIEHYAENGVERFAAFRDATVRVVGDDAVADSVRQGLLLNGLGRVADAEETVDGDAITVVTATEGGVHRVLDAVRDASSTVLPVVRIGEKVMVGMIILGALIGAGDQRSGMLRTALSRYPERGRFMVAKLIAVTLLIGVLMAVTFLVAFACGVTVALVEGVQWAPPSAVDLLAGFGAAWLIGTAWAVFGLTIAVLTRSMAATIAVGLLWALVAEQVIHGLAAVAPALETLRGALLSGSSAVLADAVGSGGGMPAGPPDLGVGAGVGILAAWIAVGAVVSVVVFRRRDVE